MTYHRWDIAPDDDGALELLKRAGYGPLAARTLARRGILTSEEAEAFFRMRPDGLHDPFLLPGMDTAVERLRLASSRGETVAVYGDYDADGVTAVCVMVRTLRGLGINCLYHIPDRERDGYGLHAEAVESLYQRGATLIITVDTGVTAHKEVEIAKNLGVDVIVTDHHECQGSLPNAVAVINPRRDDSPYPFKSLAGVGVAFKLCCALTGNWRSSLIQHADIVALGTIADIMPVTGENRLLITQGLRAMPVTRNHGLRALMNETDLKGKQITADMVAYTLAPRINAAGRVGRADAALELLLTDDTVRAGELARTLCELNVLRQSRENEVITQALEQADLTAPAFVLASEGWPSGVAGIVAARLCEQFERPVFVACLDEDMARGSARGVAGVHLVELLSGVSHLLEAFGGHSQAAGFSLRRDNLETFKKAIEQACELMERTENALAVDAEILPEWLDMSNLLELETLSPFGTGFPQPIFALRNALVTSVTPMGGGKHLRLTFTFGNQRIDAVWFNQSELPYSHRVDVAFRAEVNRFRGQETPQLRIIDMKDA